MIKKLLSLFVGIALTLFASLAHAMPPQNGWWWNPSESGSGYAIERQGNSIFMASFLYESSGAATWYVSSLTLGPDGSYQGDMLRYTGGKSLLGSYKPPTSPTVVAKVAISFKYADTGTMVISFPNGAPSRTITIYRFGFGTPTAFAPSNGSFQSGWYWNAAESGTGYFVEVQGNQAFIASFMYDTAGQPTWYVSVANLQGSNGLSGSLTKYINGQSVGGTYRAPTISGDAGVVSYNFGTGSSGTMKLPNGASVPITRFGFDSTYTTNTPPIANAGSNQSVTVGTRVSLNGSGTDSNGDNLNYYWSYLAAPANSEASLYNWTTANPYFTPDQTGTYQFGLTVDDGKASSSLALVTINAINTNTSSNGCAPATYTPNLPPMIDSLGNPVDESFGGGDAGAVGADGTAGDGAPIANAPVTITDANGKTVSTTTDALGYYRVSLKCMAPPFIAKVVREDGSTWMSGSTSSPIQRGFVTMNITGLTDKVLDYVADAAKISGGSDGVTPLILERNATSFILAKDRLVAGLQSPITFVGLDPNTYDPIKTSLKAILSDKHDKLLEELNLSKNLNSGKTMVVGTLAGQSQTYLDGNKSKAAFRNPAKLILDSKNNILVADKLNNAIRKINSSGFVTTIAGGIKRTDEADGPLISSSFYQPSSIAIDRFDNIYVVSRWSFAVRKITPNGMVNTVAYPNGKGTHASFLEGVVVDSRGNIFVTDVWNYCIYKISPEGLTSNFAGGCDRNIERSSLDGKGTGARFYSLADIAIDSDDNIFVADDKGIRKITPSGFVSTINFSSGVTSIAISKNGNIYVGINNVIRKLTSNGNMIVSPIAGTTAGFVDGNNSIAKFNSISSLVIDSFDNIYVADYWNNAVRKVNNLTNEVTTLAGMGPTCGNINDQGKKARFGYLLGVVADGKGNTYISDNGNNSIRKIDLNGNVTTFANVNNPSGLAIDEFNNIYVGSHWNQYGTSIRKISSSGVVKNISDSNSGYLDGIAINAKFGQTPSMVFDSKGNLFIADPDNNVIRKMDQFGIVSTFAGDKKGFMDGSGVAAMFYRPSGLAIDKYDNLYVADSFNQAIRKITPQGMVSTFSGGVLGLGFADGGGSTASFNNPTAITIDGSGNLYVADTFNAAIRKITPSGVVSTIAGDGTAGYINDIGSIARFNSPRGIFSNNEGFLYVTDSENCSVRVLLP